MVQMRREIIVGSILVFTLIVSIAVAITLIPTEERAEPPIWHVGDEWVYQVTGDDTYTFHHEVIAEETIDNEDCYVIEVSYTPPYLEDWGGILTSENGWVGKETGLPIKKQLSGEYGGAPFTATLTYTYHSGTDMWPLKVGKEVTLNATIIMTSTLYDSPVSGTETGTVKVEKIEDITVPAGTFTCFKVVHYEDGYIMQTSWYSDSAKYWVKRIYSETGEIRELLSCSAQ